MDELDVLVLGTGAAGLMAAVTAACSGAREACSRRESAWAFASAYSGGMIWIPANPYRPPDRSDSREQALTDLRSLSNRRISDELVEACVDGGPEMTLFLEEHTPIEWSCVPDFHPEQPGAAASGGRTLECPPYPFRRAWRVARPGRMGRGIKRAFLRWPLTDAVSVSTNTGDGLRISIRVGAMLGNMSEAGAAPSDRR